MARLPINTPNEIKEQIALEFARLTIDQKVSIARESGIITLFATEADILNSAMGSFVLARTYEANRVMELLGGLSDLIRIIPAITEELPKRKYTKRMTSTKAEPVEIDPNQTTLLLPLTTRPSKHGIVRGLPEVSTHDVVTQEEVDPFESMIPDTISKPAVLTTAPVLSQAEEQEDVDPFDNLFHEGRVRPTEDFQYTTGEGIPIGEVVSKDFGTKGDHLDVETFNGEIISRDQIGGSSEEDAPTPENGTFVSLDFDDGVTDESTTTAPVAPPVVDFIPEPTEDIGIDPFSELDGPLDDTKPVVARPTPSTEDPFADL